MPSDDYPRAASLLDAHHHERTREHAAGAAIVSVVTGKRHVACQVFARWAAGHAMHHTVAPHLDGPRLRAQLAAYPRQSGMLFLPSRGELPLALTAALGVAALEPQRAIAVAVPVPDLEDLLARDTTLEPRLRRALLGGLVFATPEAEREAATAKYARATLYRSDHENALHRLMRNHPNIGDVFEVNKRVRPDSAVNRSFEVDFWAASLRLALEVDGRHHATARQRTRDNARDKAMDAAGIKTLRVHAARVIVDPTATLNQVAAVIADRRKELQRERQATD